MIYFKQFDITEYKNAVIVTDENVSKLFGIVGDNVFVLPCGESVKSFEYLEKLCKFFLEKGLERNGTVVAVGGGVVGDLVGFASAIYKRGVNFVNYPTTLIAQIDSGIGGKTAINLCGEKNVVGAFKEETTIIDYRFVETLSQSEMKSGLGEIIKYRMLSSNIDRIARSGNLQELIRACALFKEDIVDRDFYDVGDRKMLNAGHTIGHAIELSHKLSHGEAIANGLYYELILSEKLGIVTKEFAESWQKKIAEKFDLVKIDESILPHLTNDKKNENGRIGFSFATGNGYEFRLLNLEKVKELLQL